MSQLISRQPYVGPRPFADRDEMLFFGREGEANELLSLAISHPVVLLYAQSGAGKTSLLNARLIPMLKKQGYEALPSARVQGNECGPETNIYVYNTLMSWGGGQSSPQEMTRLSLADFLEARPHLTNQESWEMPRFIIFDQFEEFFTAYPHRWEERRGFFEQLRDALANDYLLRVILAMREDYIAEMDPYASLLPEKLRTRFRMERLRETAALSAVKEPLKRVTTKRRFATGVAEQLVQNLLRIPSEDSNNGQVTGQDGEQLLGQFVEPVQLQVVCQNLWQALPPEQPNSSPEDNLITMEHLQAAGDVTKALSDFYERSIKDAVEDSQKNADEQPDAVVKERELRLWFERVLITSDGNRGIVFRGRDKTGEIPNTTVDFLQKLQLVKEEKRGRGRWYELSHDRFIEPIRKSNEKWRNDRAGVELIGQKLEERANSWVNSGRGSDGLLNEAELLEADSWRSSPDAADMTPSEKLLALMFTSRSVIREAEQARKYEHAQALIAEQERRAEAETQRAEEQRLRAEAEAERASEQRLRAEAEAQRAEEQGLRAAADRQRVKQFKLGMVAMSALLLLMIGLAAFAFEKQSAAKTAQTKLQEQYGKLAEKEAALRTAQSDLVDKNEELGAINIRLSDQSKVLERRNTELSTQGQALKTAKDALSKQNAELVSQGTKLRKAQTDLVATNTQLTARNIALTARENELKTARDTLSERNIDLQKTVDQYRNQTRISESRRLANLAENSSNLNPDLSGRLAFEAATIGPTEEARVALKNALVKAEQTDFENVPLNGHTDRITDAAFSRDGKYVVTSSEDRTAKLWDASGKFIRTFAGHTAMVSTVAFSPDGKILATEAMDTTGKLWDVETGKELFTLEGLRGPVTAIAFNSDGTRLASEGMEDSDQAWTFIYLVRVWNVADGKEQFRLSGLTEAVTAVAFSHNDKFVVAGSRDGLVKMWNANDGKEWKTLSGHTSAITTVAFSPDDRFLVTAGQDGVASVWDVETGKMIVKLPGKKYYPNRAIFNHDGRMIVLTSGETARIWKLNDGQWVSGPELRGHTKNIAAVDFSPNNTQVLTASLDNTARVWDVNTGLNISILRRHSGGVVSASFKQSSSENIVLTASQDRTARIWNLNKRTGGEARPAPELRGHEGLVFGVAFNQNAERALTSSEDGTARIWDVKTGTVIHVLPHESAVTRSQYSLDGKLIVTASSDGTARIWDANTGARLQDLRTDAGKAAAASAEFIGLFSAAFSPDSKYVVASGVDSTAWVWEWRKEKGSPILLKGHKGIVFSAVFSPGGGQVLTAGEDGTARLWDTATGAPGKIIGGTGSQVIGSLYSAAFSPNGKYIVTAGEDMTAKLWDASTGNFIKELRGHTDEVTCAVFSHDNNYVLTTSTDKTARVWDVATGQTISTLRGHSGDVVYAAFSPKDNLIITGSADQTARIYSEEEFEPIEKLLASARQLGFRGLTSEEKLVYLPETNSK